MRTRNRITQGPSIEPGTAEFDYYRTSDGAFLQHYSVGWGRIAAVSGLTEDMVDSVDKSKVTKEVEHTVKEYKLHPVNCPAILKYPGANYEWRNLSSLVSIWSQLGIDPTTFMAGWVPNYGFGKTDAQLISAAKHKFFSDNEVNNLLSAIEFDSLIGTLRDISSTVLDLKRKRQLPKLRKLSSLYLGYSFGIAPLISDLRKMSRLLPQMRKRLEQKRKEGLHTYTARASERGVLQSTAFTPGANGYNGLDAPPSGNAYTGSLYWHGQVTGQAVRMASVQGSDKTSYSSGVFSYADTLLRQVITTGPATLAWELVPFSFVVDWFVDTSSALDYLDQTLTGSPKKIEDIWLTTRVEATVPMVFHRNGDRILGCEGQEVGSMLYKYYHRKPMSDDFSVTWSGRFGKKQVALSAALLHQIVANLR